MKIAPIRLNAFNSAVQPKSTPKETQGSQNHLKSDFSFANNCIANINMTGINFKSSKPDTSIKGHLEKIYSSEHGDLRNAQNATLVAKSVIDKFEKAKQNGLEVGYDKVETEDGTWRIGQSSIGWREEDKRLQHSFIDSNNIEWFITVDYNQNTNYIHQARIGKYNAQTGKSMKDSMQTKCGWLGKSMQDKLDANADMLEEVVNKADKNYKTPLDEHEIIREAVKLNRAIRNKYTIEKQQARLNGCFENDFTDSDGNRWIGKGDCVFEDQGKKWGIIAGVNSNNIPRWLEINCQDIATGEDETYEIRFFDEFGPKYSYYEEGYGMQKDERFNLDFYDDYEYFKEPYSQIEVDKSAAVSQAVIDKQKELEEAYSIQDKCECKDEAIKMENLGRYIDSLNNMIKNIKEYECDKDYYDVDIAYLENKLNKATAEYKKYKKHTELDSAPKYISPSLHLDMAIAKRHRELAALREKHPLYYDFDGNVVDEDDIDY